MKSVNFQFAENR